MNQNDDPAALPAAKTPPASAPPPIIANPPPPAGKPSFWRKAAAILLSLFLGLFLTSGIVSVVDDSSVLFFGTHLFTSLSAILTFITLFAAVIIYGLMGITPLIPKRIVLPIVFFMALSLFAMFPVAIYGYRWTLLYDLLASVAIIVLSVGMLRWLQGTWKFRWPLVPDKRLGTRAFSWLNLSVFLLLNFFVLLPLVALGLGACAGATISHFTDGFVSLRPSGIVMQARKYTRDDGKTILLFPMSHIAEADFYTSVGRTVSSNSVVLLEGVTDTNNLLTHGISYRRVAKALHLSEQHEGFSLKRGELVRADVDVSQFSSNTIVMLNLVMLLYSEGLNAHTLSTLFGYTPTPEAEQQLLDDLLLKRNEHLLSVLRARLPDADDFIIPWGAAHMAGISREIQKSGFHLAETRDIMAIRFIGRGSSNGGAGGIQPLGKSN